MVKKIAFVNIKGGCAKTTSLYNVAGVLASKKKKVLIIDLDRQCNSTKTFLLDEKSEYNKNDKTILDVFSGEHIEDVIKQNYIVGIGERKSTYRNIDIIPGSSNLKDDKSLRNMDLSGLDERYNSFLENNKYDYVLIDMPANSQILNEICFKYLAEYVLCPFSSDLYSIDGYSELMKVIRDARKYNENLKILGIFLSRYMKNCAVDRFIKDSLESFGKIFINEIQVPFRADIRETIMLGKPISYYKNYKYKKNPRNEENIGSREAYERLVREIEKRIKQADMNGGF